MNKKLLFSGLLLLSSPLLAQEFSGYVSGMPSLIVQQPGGNVWWQMLVHNRLHLGWQMSELLRVDVAMRNRFIAGSEAMLSPQSLRNDFGWIRLSWNWAQGRKALANTTVDRLYVSFEKGKWKLQAGRQRINWGQTFVWNPNNIFNTHSFFDFDYPERPGGDALRATYFHNETSSSELAIAVNHESKITAAFLHRWNWRNMDFQVMAGEQAEADFVLGGAWTSDFEGLNVRGEVSYFHPFSNKAGARGVVAVSIGADYVFSNSLMLQAEALFNNVGKAFSGGGLMGLYSAPLSAKYLSISDWNVFAQISGPLTPRLNASLSGMYFVDIQSWYAGLSLDYSVAENLDFSVFMQMFSAFGNAKLLNMQAFFGFARLKYSF